MGFSIRNGGTKEPKPGAPTEQLLDVVERRVHAVRKDPTKLARERLRVLRGLVGPIADFVSYEILDATSKAIALNPATVDVSAHDRRLQERAPAVVLASIHARDEIRTHAKELDQARIQPNPTAQMANSVIQRTRATTNKNLYAVGLEGSQTALSFPINAAGAYIFQRSGEQSSRVVSEYTADQYLEVLTSMPFQRVLHTATTPAGGLWAEASTDIHTDPYVISSLKKFYSPFFEPGSDGFTPGMLEEFKLTRGYKNQDSMINARAENHHRLTSGCPVARPHTGEPNIYERAAIGVLEAIGASEYEIARSMQGASIDRGLQLGIQVCELVQEFYPEEDPALSPYN